MSYVRKFYDLSTNHLTPEARALLAANAGPSVCYPHPDGYGWFVYIGELNTIAEWADGHPQRQCLLDCANAGRQRDCDYLLFDCDAGESAELPTYNEEDENNE